MAVKQMILLFLLLPMWGLPPATTYQINKCDCIEQGKPYQVHNIYGCIKDIHYNE